MVSLKDLLCCPITQEIMRDPVLLSDGSSYERDAITKWLNRSCTSPVTNLPVSRQVYSNRALLDVIKKFQEGRLCDVEKFERKSSPSSSSSQFPSSSLKGRLVNSPPKILNSEGRLVVSSGNDLKVYRVTAKQTMVYDSLREVYLKEDVKFRLDQDDVILSNEQVIMGDRVFVSIYGPYVGYVYEGDLTIVSNVQKKLFVLKISNDVAVGYRFIPNGSTSAIQSKRHFAPENSLKCGNICVKGRYGIRYYYIENCGFIPEQVLPPDLLAEPEIFAKNVAIERVAIGASPWVLEAEHDLDVRKFPDYDQGFKTNPKRTLRQGRMIVSWERVKGQYGDMFYRVVIDGVSGWLFASRQGEQTIKVWDSEPKRLSRTPGEAIQLCCEDSWVLIMDKEDENNKITQVIHWSNKAPWQVCKQINNCISKDRLVNGIAFRNHYWYISGEKRDGSGGYCWGNIPNIACGAKVSVGDDDEYAVCFRFGGYRSRGLDSNLIDEMYKSQTINSIFYESEDDYYVRYNKTHSYWCFRNRYLRQELESKGKGRGAICSVAKFNDGSWIVLRDLTAECSVGVPKVLKSHLEKFYETQGELYNAQKRRIEEYHRTIANQ